MALTEGEEKQGLIELSKDELKEFLRCKKSFYYFVTHYVYVRNKNGKIVKFKPWAKQKKFLKSIQENKWLLVAAARQIGKSVIVGAFSLWLAIFYPNQNIVIMSNKGDSAKKFLKKMKVTFSYLPQWLQDIVTPFTIDNKHTLEFANRSMIESINTTEEGPRGDSLSLLIWDETAFTPENIQWELYSGVAPAVNQNRLIMISTFKNDDEENLFYSMYSNSTSGSGNFYVIDDMDWTTDPNRTIEWYNQEKETWKTSLAKFHREYDVIPGIPDKCDFNIEKLLEMEKNTIEPIEYDSDLNLRIFEEPKPNIEYIMGIDVSEGVERDCHALQLFRLDTMTQVADLHNNTLEISDFANVCVNIGHMYNNALLIPERNNPGLALIEVIEKTLLYDNLFIDMDGMVGVRTTSSSKERMYGYTATSIVYDLFTILSKATIHQMKLFKKRLSQAEKRKKRNDLVMSLMVMMYGIVDLGLNEVLTVGLKTKLENEKVLKNKIKNLKTRTDIYIQEKSEVNNPSIFF